jgi:dCTP deaminase
MSLLTYNKLTQLVADKVLTPVPIDYINGASIDVRLNNTLFVEARVGRDIDLAKKETANIEQVDVPDNEAFILNPLEFCLAATFEVFNLPNNIACEFRLKSTAAREGLDQSLAVWCDPSWHGSVLTIELRNNWQRHRHILRPGMKIGQIIFYEGESVPNTAAYATRGQYNNDATTTPSKGLR